MNNLPLMVNCKKRRNNKKWLILNTIETHLEKNLSVLSVNIELTVTFLSSAFKQNEYLQYIVATWSKKFSLHSWQYRLKYLFCGGA
jgi:hypothetical protein